MLAPLLDRIEVIHVPAYLPIEKLNIAKQYLIPHLEKEYNFICDVQPSAHIFATESASPASQEHFADEKKEEQKSEQKVQKKSSKKKSKEEKDEKIN